MGCLLLSGADGGDAGSDKRNNSNNNNKAQASEALDCTKEKADCARPSFIRRQTASMSADIETSQLSGQRAKERGIQVQSNYPN